LRGGTTTTNSHQPAVITSNYQLFSRGSLQYSSSIHSVQLQPTDAAAAVSINAF
jgi:hypothetical protein